jgi:hypothetical protein
MSELGSGTPEDCRGGLTNLGACSSWPSKAGELHNFFEGGRFFLRGLRQLAVPQPPSHMSNYRPALTISQIRAKW